MEATTRLRQYITKLQEDYLNKIDKASGGELKTLPQEVDRSLHALSVRLSHDLEFRFRKVGERVLAQDLVEPVAAGYAESMKLSPRWAAEFRGFWDLPEDFAFDAPTPTLPADLVAVPGQVVGEPGDPGGHRG